MGTKSVDSGGDQRQEAAGNEETIRRPPMAERAIARAKGFGEISKNIPVAIYIARPCRCDRVEQLGGTEMQNRKRLLQLSVTEWF